MGYQSEDKESYIDPNESPEQKAERQKAKNYSLKKDAELVI